MLAFRATHYCVLRRIIAGIHSHQHALFDIQGKKTEPNVFAKLCVPF